MLFDADGHYIPKAAHDRMEGAYAHLRPKVITDAAGATLYFDGTFHPTVAHSFNEAQTCDIDRRIADLDKLGIDMQVLFPNHSGLFYTVDDPKAGGGPVPEPQRRRRGGGEARAVHRARHAADPAPRRGDRRGCTAWSTGMACARW